MEKPWVEPIRRLMVAKRWNQGQLAEKADIRPSTLSEVMNGRSPRMDTMEAIAAALEAPLWALYVDARQYDVLTRQQVADEALSREAEITDRVERRIMERLAAIVRSETSAELTAGPQLIAPQAPEDKKSRRAG